MRSSLLMTASAVVLIGFALPSAADAQEKPQEGKGAAGAAREQSAPASPAPAARSERAPEGKSGKSAEGAQPSKGEKSRAADDGNGASKQKAAEERKGSGESKAKAAEEGGRKGGAAKSKSADDSSRKTENRAGDKKSASDSKSEADKSGKAGDTAKQAQDRAGRDSKRGNGSATGAGEGTAGAAREPAGSAAENRGGGGAARVQISENQRSTVHDRILKSGNVNRVSKVDVNISIGTRVPRSIRLVRLPPTIVEIVPAYRSYEYFVVDDRICIVEPSTYEIVDVIDNGPGPGRATRVEASLQLTAAERDVVLRAIAFDRDARDHRIPREGSEVSKRITVHVFPEGVLREVPKLERYRYYTAERSVIVVDPKDERVELIVGNK